MPAAKNSFGTAEPTAGLLDRETTVVAPLVRDKIASATRLLELQRQLEQALGEPGLSNVGIEKLLSGIMKLEIDANNA